MKGDRRIHARRTQSSEAKRAYYITNNAQRVERIYISYIPNMRSDAAVPIRVGTSRVPTTGESVDGGRLAGRLRNAVDHALMVAQPNAVKRYLEKKTNYLYELLLFTQYGIFECSR